jgi:HSP20 family protein
MRTELMPLRRNGFGLDSTFDRFLTEALEPTTWQRRAEVQEHADHAEVVIELPGVRPEQLSVSSEHRTLTVRVEREGRNPQLYHYTVGSQYDLGAVEARLELGVLTLRLPKAAEAKPRQVTVQVG